MEFSEGMQLLNYAREQENDLKLYARWVVGYQSTSSFIEFKNELMKSSTNDERSADEILQKVEAIMERF